MLRLQRINLDLILYCLIFILGLGWILYIAIASKGVPVHDEIAHFLISKNAWQQPKLLLYLWGRPICNLVYWIPAIWELSAARFFSITITGITIIILTQIGSLLGVKRLYLIPLFIWFQPWVSALSFSVLPQIPFSLLLTLGVYLGLKEKHIGASLAFGLLPLTRYEGIAVLGVWLLYVLILRNWKAFYVAFLPLIAFLIVYFFVNNEFALSMYFHAKPTDRYGSGHWFHYIRPLPNKIGYFIMSFCMISIVPIIKSRRKMLTFAPYIIYLAIHMIIYRYGLFASGGYYLFLLPLAPAFGLASAIGFEFILSLLGRIVNAHSRILVTPNVTKFMLIIIVAAIVIFTGFKTNPLPLGSEGKALQQAASWLKSKNINKDQVVSTHVWFKYFYDYFPPKEIPPIDELLPGTVIVWDAHYSERKGIFYDQLINSNNCWRKLESFGKDDFAVLFIKSSDILQFQ